MLSRNMWVMMDVVPNHMGEQPGCTYQSGCTEEGREDFSPYFPFNEPKHYHDFCDIQDFDNETEV